MVAVRKSPNILDEWNGYPEIFSFSQAIEISRQYLLLRTVILQKKFAGCPEWNCFKVSVATDGEEMNMDWNLKKLGNFFKG